MFYFLVYVSSATVPFAQKDLEDLLEVSRRNNKKLNISGILLYKDGNFMQMLEGEEEAVKQLYDKISLDIRHGGTIVILDGYEEERQFADWSMGFRSLNSPEVLALPGYNKFLNTPLTGREFSENPSEAQELLLMFKEKNR
ncbi:MAG: BLUF domain-containing protein [Ignavibacteriales bacterium]|nr:BLUF domain-containing protein [Ignavibacteriaceae bacterium]QOJ27908.1 MAG: BLUF domain-containing protein [Ignavibacteriales bacterium]